MIERFEEEYCWLSNFFTSPIVYEGKQYKSVEHAYQAAKMRDEEWKEKIRQVSYAGKAKRLGRQGPMKHGWDGLKIPVMLMLLKLKFEIPELRQKLLATDDEFLKEGNEWHDNFWGDCFCSRCRRIKGSNYLGKLLMQVRDEIKRGEKS